MIAQLSEGSDAQLADTGLTTFSGIGLDYHKLHDPERTWGDPLQMESALVNTSCPGTISMEVSDELKLSLGEGADEAGDEAFEAMERANVLREILRLTDEYLDEIKRFVVEAPDNRPYDRVTELDISSVLIKKEGLGNEWIEKKGAFATEQDLEEFYGLRQKLEDIVHLSSMYRHMVIKSDLRQKCDLPSEGLQELVRNERDEPDHVRRIIRSQARGDGTYAARAAKLGHLILAIDAVDAYREYYDDMLSLRCDDSLSSAERSAVENRMSLARSTICAVEHVYYREDVHFNHREHPRSIWDKVRE